MKQIIIIILATFTFQVSGQKLRPETTRLVQKIEKYNELDSEHVGISGVTTDQYRNFERLRDNASTDELIKLLKHKNAVVKGYASWALVDNMYPKLADILTEFLRTGETATAQRGCIAGKNELATEFYNRVFYQHFHNKLSLNDSLFFQSQIQQLDSVILYGAKDGFLLYFVLSHNNGNLKNYDRIRHLAFNAKNSSAIQALGVYQRKEDIDDFKKLKEKAFICIPVFPDNDFWEFLLSFKEDNQSRSYLMALSAFRTEESAKVLLETLPKMKAENIKDLSEAITQNYCAYYQDLILAIWEQHKIIDIRTTTQIIKDIPEKAAKSFSIGLLSNKELDINQHDYHFESSDSILLLMLDNIKTYQSSKLLNICEQNIETATLNTLRHILNFVIDNELIETSDNILQRLQQKNQAYENFHLAETILYFNNPDNKEKLISILKMNQKDWDWGNWSAHFRKLFSDFDIKFD